MNGPATEIRVLLLTDVVDSTKLSERLGDEVMAGLWAAHDRAARDLLREWRGREIDKTDGMLLMFQAANDAVRYVDAYHRALATLPVPLRARAGLHVGPVVLRHNSDADVALGAKPLEVDGLAKPTVARVMAAAAGGQTLLTAEARAALADTPLRIHCHGHWAMKGLGDPIELFEVGGPDKVFELPPDSEKAYQVARVDDQWQAVREIPNNLPQQVTSFVGREREVREVSDLVATTRLVTLLGMGGLGKTRLSLRVATNALGLFPDGVWFLDLAPIRDPALVVSEAAQTLGVREEPDRPLIQTLCLAVKSCRLLLILDNCEHVVKASADFAAAILRASPKVHILASSREALRVPGERSYPVPPLPLPDQRADMGALTRSAAVRLFVERAQLHKPAFALNERDAPAVVELVRRLEGIPLALELAAARVRSLSVAEINARLKDRYKLLTGGGRVLLERQQTLRALVDWSYELLTPSEQTVLNRLSIFAGGFDLPAAETVCGAEPVSSDDVLDHLSSLVEKSLVMTGEVEDGTRYRMLETIRDYAREKLQGADDAAATAESHCQHYFAVAKNVRDGLKGSEQAKWVQRGEAELDNMRAAIAGVLTGPDAVLAVKYAVALTSFWTLRGYTSEGRKIVQAARSQPAVKASDIAYAHALFVEAALATDQNDHAEARDMLETCLALRRLHGRPVEIAATLSTLSQVQLQGGDAAGAAASEREALAIFREIGEKLGEAIALLHLGQIAVYAGDEALAHSSLSDCLRIARAIENREIEGEVHLRLGEWAFEHGRHRDARNDLYRSLELSREAGDRRGEVHALWWLGRTDLQAGDLDAARGRFDDVLQTFRDFEMREELADCLEDHAILACLDGEPATAARLAGATHEFRRRRDLVLSPVGQRRWEQRLRTLREALPEAAFNEAWTRGRNTEIDDAIAAAQAHATDRVPAR
ncbi:MAG TPA: hypothetical protein VI032_14710 [Burkholderiaceae bacterium]